MTDEQLDRLIRDIDPYRPGLIGRLDGAEQTLLEEIMSTPRLGTAPEPGTAPVPPPRRTHVRRLAGAVAAAAAVTGVLAVSALLPDRPAGTGTGAQPAASASAPADPGGEGAGYRLDLAAAQGHPRLLIDQDGWRVTTVYGFAEEQGTLGFRNGTREAELNWYPASSYQQYFESRKHVSKPRWTTVAGLPASVVSYGSTDFAAMLKPRDGLFVELRVTGLQRPAFDTLLTRVMQVSAETFLKALPPEVVTPGRVGAAAAKLLAGVPLPPGFDAAGIDVGGANDPYQFGVVVAGRVGCAWIAEWVRADKAGDAQARGRAATALRGSHGWTMLKDMNAAGDYPEAFWEVADKVAAGRVPQGYRDAIGCA